MACAVLSDAAHERKGKSRKEEEGRDGPAAQGEDHGSDVRDAEELYQREQGDVPAERGRDGGVHCGAQVQIQNVSAYS